MIGNAEHPLGMIYGAIRDDFQAKCVFPAGSVSPATRRRMIFIAPPGALVPASATIYEFELRPNASIRAFFDKVDPPGVIARLDRATPSLPSPARGGG